MAAKYRRMFWIILILMNAAFAGAIVYAGFSGRDFSVNQRRNSRLIGESYMTMNNEFYVIISEVLEAQVEARGDRVILRDPALDSERQIEQVEEMLDEGIDVLVITPVDWTTLTDVLKKAKEQGVYVVVVDTEVSDPDIADCTITSDNYEAGCLVGEYFLTQNETAQLVILKQDTAKSGQDRTEGFIDTVTTKSGIEIVEEIECFGQLEIAMPQLKEAIEAGVEFDNVFCLNDLAAVGAVAALDEKGLLEDVGVYGVDASPDAKALINAGMMKATAAQFPTEMASKAAEVIYALLDGEAVEKTIRMPVELVTKDNVEEYGIDQWQ